MSRFDIANMEKIRPRLRTLSDRDLNEFGRVLLKNCRPELSRVQPLSRSETLLQEAQEERRRRKPAKGKLKTGLPVLQPKV